MTSHNEKLSLDKQSKLIGKHTLAEIGESWPHYKEKSLLEDAVLQASEHTQVAYEMALSSALGVMSAACQGLVKVAYPNGHSIPTSLFILILAESGERKTSLDSLFTKPLNDFQKTKNISYKKAQSDYQRQLSNWKLKEKELQKKMRVSIRNDRDITEVEQALQQLDQVIPAPPNNYKLIYQNTTPSALLFSMYKNTPLAFLLSNEAGSLLKGPALSDLSLLNSLWDGKDISVDRRATESFTLSDAHLSASIMVQPGILKRFIEERGDEATDSGFFARFLVVYPESKIGQRGKLSPPLTGPYLTKFQDRVLERIKQSVESINTGKEKTVLKFTKSAQALWAVINEHIENELKTDSIYTHANGHGCKLVENISRIAAIIHTFEEDNYDSEISHDNLLYAYKLSRHYSKAYMQNIADTPEIIKNTSRLVKAIKTYGQPYTYANNPTSHYTFKRSTITQKAHQELRKNDSLNSALELLERLGHLKKEKRDKTYIYEFSDDIYYISRNEPELKNGELYYVEDLPKFSEQEKRPPGRFA